MALGGTAPPRGSAAAAAANLRRRRTGGGPAGGASNTMLQFYTDDAPGLKISPNVVLVMSIGFIAFVAILHVMAARQHDPWEGLPSVLSNNLSFRLRYPEVLAYPKKLKLQELASLSGENGIRQMRIHVLVFIPRHPSIAQE
ncbi:unnamed protein product [Thlaspi arvense]|uniref:Protein transport protein Sec61 subunit beta n=1 Tax=Thlaspi arvense TaxID=13288 RepID=A0AAU9T7R2_THLAR|nr:unnamed protein product [Thlaspi arvense]